MNKLKYVLILILCIGIGGASFNAAAQTSDRILVSAGGKTLRQADINKMIEFYEWALDIKFSNENRTKFAEITTGEFRTDPAKSRASYDDLIATYAQVQAAREDVREQTRRRFVESFLPELRQDNGETAQLLVAIYDAAHSESNVAANDDSNSSLVSGNVSDLVGNWAWARSGSTSYTTGGAMVGSNGSRFTYQFFANGTVEYTGIMNVVTGGCTMQIFRNAKGKASLNGSRLTINWSPASFSRDDSCDRAGNYKKTLPAETQVFQVGLKNDDGQRQLCLTEKEEMCFSPTK